MSICDLRSKGIPFIKEQHEIIELLSQFPKGLRGQDFIALSHDGSDWTRKSKIYFTSVGTTWTIVPHFFQLFLSLWEI